MAIWITITCVPSNQVVVIEPDEELRAAQGLALARVGYRVASCSDGRSGLRLVNGVLPAIVITEIVLPSLDGFQLATRLRSQEKTRDVGIVAVTSYDGEDLNRRAAQCGIDAVLRKPEGTYDLVRIVRRTIENSRELAQKSAVLRADVHKEVERSRRLVAEVRRQIRQDGTVGAERASRVSALLNDETLLRETEAARDVMIVDNDRGGQLFTLLLARYDEHPIVYFRRGEAYRAGGNRKLAHADFTHAAARTADVVWHQRMVFAAMRTRSYHD